MFILFDPKAYKEIAELLDKKKSERKDSVDAMIKSVEKNLEGTNIKYRIKGRAKHIYSIYKRWFISISVLMKSMI